MSSQHARLPGDGQARVPQLVAAKRNRVYAKRVPSCLTPEQRNVAVMSVRAGRSVHQVANELSCAEVVVLELYVRDLERRTGRAA